MVELQWSFPSHQLPQTNDRVTTANPSLNPEKEGFDKEQDAGEGTCDEQWVYRYVTTWRWIALGLQSVILAVVIASWIVNMQRKWGRISRRWSVTHVQMELGCSSQKKPTLALSAMPKNLIRFQVRDEVPGLLPWPRKISPLLVLGAPPGTPQQQCVADYTPWGYESVEDALIPVSTCFSEIDVALLSVLTLWISTSYLIFFIPNRRKVIARSGGCLGLPVLWRKNWVVGFMLLWNFVALLVIFIGRTFLGITPASAVLGGSSIVWNMGIHLFWTWVGKQTSKFPEEQPYAEERSLQYWVQFMRLNELAFTAPLLLVCFMGAVQDSQLTSNVQYVVFFSTAGLNLLLPMDALSVAMQV